MKQSITNLLWQSLVFSIVLFTSSLYAQNIELIGSYDTPGQAQGIFIAGDLAYIADGEAGLQIIDISDKANPALTGNYATSDKAHDVYVENDFAYIAADHAGLEIIDITDPANPVFTGEYDTPCNTQNVIIGDGIAYLADIYGGFITLNISNPSQPELLASFNEVSVRNFTIRDNLAYLAVSVFGIIIIDILNPAELVRVGGLYLPPYHTAGSIDIKDEYAYLACGDEGIWTIDISDPANPEVVAQTPTQGRAVDICILNEYAYVADSDGGLIVFDISEPAYPMPVGLYQPDDEALAVEVNNEFIYAAYENDGLLILQFTEPATSVELETKPGEIEDIPVITFDPLVGADVGVSDILSPPMELSWHHSYPKTVEVTNYGTDGQTFNLVYEFYNLDSTGHSYSDTLLGCFLAGQSSQIFTLNDSIHYDWIGYRSHCQSIVFTNLAEDEDHSNDTTIAVHGGDQTVFIWYGSVDGSPVTVYPGASMPVDVFLLGPFDDWGDAGVADFCLALGADNQYIDSLILEAGTLYYPLTAWDYIEIMGNYGSPPNPEGWRSQSIWGFAELWPPYDSPLILYSTPTRIFTTVVKTRNDTSFIGETIACIGTGLDSIQGPSNTGDAGCGAGLSLHEFFSPFHFEPRIEYMPGDVNIFRGAWPPLVIGNDVTYFVNYFRGMENNPPCNLGGFFASADINGDCRVIGSDVTRLVEYFRGQVSMSFCPEYYPAWPTTDDLPLLAPQGWPNCETQ
ncbi:MAG: hypothetical protein GY839_07940 [candidate division Zixibacteria bacterium]|nr:hypothetical protein [candidate division Zixibacteria bacterium]